MALSESGRGRRDCVPVSAAAGRELSAAARVRAGRAVELSEQLGRAAYTAGFAGCKREYGARDRTRISSEMRNSGRETEFGPFKHRYRDSARSRRGQSVKSVLGLQRGRSHACAPRRSTSRARTKTPPVNARSRH